ncbi:Putative prenyltransferase, contains 1,4-dihydroxy-2-naphthoate octaprenyltransferase domain [Halorubrum sp. DM2]|uniref:prenyltransferase n=1 Tax=Halorubrum sp. DM2 TaxID=2527867 RepID=UPI0024B77B57|nr:prenyltransferase [Halorubrum sp. DM2]VTT86390.1 Putative prenyltransferase, contains 1,4-dihydroxy-2-naphthoate octaprenyltransferase domain [Halorubrum sp. DM2]
MCESDRRTVLVALWRMSRPAQIALIGLVYALGVSMALGRGATVDLANVGIGLAALVSVAASVHYANEYADAETDALTDRTPFSGGSGALAETGLQRRLALCAAVASAAIGLLLLAWAASPLGGRPLSTVHAVLLGGILLVGWQYSVGPLRLAWRGFGEITNAALGGIALPLYGFAVVAGELTLDAALATVPFALVVFVNLLETQWPDRRADAAVGKQTLATRWSPRRLRAVYGLVSLAAAGSGVALAGRVLPSVVVVGTLVPMVGLVPGYRRFTRREEPLPAVATMVVTAATTTVAWGAVAAGLVG